MAQGGFYAVRKGTQTGIYTDWPTAEAQVRGFQGAQHAKFKSRDQAERYLQDAGLSAGAAKAAPPRAPVDARQNVLASGSGPSKLAKNGRGQKRPGSPDLLAVGTARGKTNSGVRHLSEQDLRRILGNGETGSPFGERVVFCDGSSLGNGKRGAEAGIGVYWEATGVSLAEKLPGKLQTNNRAEMYSIARILESDPHPELALTIKTDSMYCIQCFSTWILGWRRNNWINSTGQAVKNQDLILYVLSLLALRRPSIDSKSSLLANIKFVKVKAHIGIHGNERADDLAKEGASLPTAVDRDFRYLTALNEARLKDALVQGMLRPVHPASLPAVGAQLFDVTALALEGVVVIEDGDLLSPAELARMEATQAFD